MKLILDTHVWLDALVFKHPPIIALFATWDAHAACMLATPAMLDEFSRVISRRHFKLDPAQREQCAQQQRARVTLCAPAPDCRLACTDPADQMFIDLAVAHQADALLSRDKALLRLRRPAAQRFQVCVSTPEAYALALHANQPPPILSAPTEREPLP